MRWLLKPVRLRRCHSLREFVVRILLQQFAVKVAVSIPVGICLGLAGVDTKVVTIIGVLVVAPVLETLLLQSLPIEVARRFRGRRWVQLAAGAVPFAALHFIGGIASGLAAGVVGGLFFAYTYLEGRERSWATATVATAVVHFLHNLVILPLMLISASYA